METLNGPRVRRISAVGKEKVYGGRIKCRKISHHFSSLLANETCADVCTHHTVCNNNGSPTAYKRNMDPHFYVLDTKGI